MCPDLLQLIQSLVRIDSRNSTPLDSDIPRQADEEQMAAFLESHLQARGLQVERQYAAPRRPNLVAATPRNPAWPTLAFEAHMDTVGTQGMTIDPFAAEIRGGRVFGRGACDTKGSMAAMLTAIDVLRNDKAPINLLFLAACAEETGCEGIRHVDLGAWPIDGIIVGEPTSNHLVTAHKASGSFVLTCRGRAAHGARPETGCNAIYRSLDLVHFLRATIIPELAAHQAPGFSGSTLSVNMITGGTKANIVPDTASITVDLRLVPGQPDPETLMTQIVRRAAKELEFEVSISWSHCTPGLKTNPDSPLVKAAQEALAKQGLGAEISTVSYCTDGGVLAQQGYDCVILGPGDIRQAHGAVEFLELAELEQAVDIYVDAAWALSRRQQA